MSVVRCSIAAIGVSVLQYLLDILGPGWTFTLLGGLCTATVPLLLSVRLWGMQWRTIRKERQRQHQTGNESFVGDIGPEPAKQENGDEPQAFG